MHNYSLYVLDSLLTSGIVASDTSTDWNSAGLDMRGYEGVRFVVGTLTTSTGLSNAHVEMSATSSDLGTWIDVQGSAAYPTTGYTTGQGTAVLITDAYRPMYRWVRLQVDRVSTGESILFATAEQYRATALPTSSVSTARQIADVTVVVGSSGTATG